MTRKDYNNVRVSMKVQIEHETEKAYYLVFQDANNRTVKIWVPKSQVSEVIHMQDGSGDCVLYIAEWVLKSKMVYSSNLTEEDKTKLDQLTVQGKAGYNDSRMPEHKRDKTDPDDDIPF